MGLPSALTSFLPPAVCGVYATCNLVLLFSSQQKLVVDLSRLRAIFSRGAVGMNSSPVTGVRSERMLRFENLEQLDAFTPY